MRRRSISWVSCAFVLALAGHASGAIPEGWSNRDIGTTGGSAGESRGTWTVSGDGADLWGSSDAFHFVYLPLSGNGEVTARVVDRGAGSSMWSKGGVMIRETLTPGSKHAMMAITGGDGGGLAFQNRQSTGGQCYSAHGNPTASPPYWVRLKREGNTFTAYSSSNGLDWVQQPDGAYLDATRNPVEIPMIPDVFAGLFVNANAAGEIRTYTFDHVTVGRPATAGGPEPKDRAVHPDTWAQLSWAAGSTADSHDVYFSGSFAEVRDGAGDAFRGNQRANHFAVGLPGSPYPEGLVPGTTYFWRIDEVEADGETRHRGSVWRFFVSTEKAFHPTPRDGAQLVSIPVTLTWSAGSGAPLHRVYFGEDYDMVANADEAGRPQGPAEYPCPNAKLGKRYYWRVDEVDKQTTHKGDVWSFTTRPPELASAAVYYIDEGSPDAGDLNPGTEALPWKTIRRGTQSLQPGDILLIKAGTYREGVILHSSGTQAKPIRIWAYPGHEGKVILNAAEPVTRWRKCTGPEECAGNPYWDHIYHADVADLVKAHPNSAFAVRQVFQHGQLLDRSRYPNAGWSYPTGIADPRTKFADRSLAKPDGYFTGSVCHVKTAVWHIDSIPIVSFSRGAVTLASSPRFNIATAFGYYITSVVGEINEEGEWAYDPAQRRIFLWPQDGAPEGVEFTYRDYCLRTYDHTSWNVVRGLTMRNAYTYGIWLYQATDMTIESNTVEHTFDCGIYLQATHGTCANNHIANNTVRYSSATGIATDLAARNNTIEGNYVYATGTDHFGGDLMHGPSHAVFISGPATRVYNNRIDRTGYTALYLYDIAVGQEVSYNYITNVALALSDAAGIYMGSFQPGPEYDHIHHNIIEDVIGCRSMEQARDRGLPVTMEKYSGDAPGIYVDEKGNHRIIEDNTVINSHMAGIFFHWAPDNVVQRNTLYGNRLAQVFLSGKDEARTKLVDDVVLDNILFATDAQQKTLYIGMNYDDVRFGQSDNNYFYNPHADKHIHVSRYVAGAGGAIQVVREDLTLAEWCAMSGYDRGSREFAHLDRLGDITIDPERKSRIIYNPSLDVVSVDLGSGKYCDVQGNKVHGIVHLPPFESKVLISAGYEISGP